MKAPLPQPDADELAHSETLRTRITERIHERGGWLSFSEYMNLCLYEPALGYYVSGSRVLGAAGDFTTAPELSPIFGQCVANTLRPVLAAQPDLRLLEFGAGSGALAASLLPALARTDELPAEYLIIEPSPQLRRRQAERIDPLASELGTSVRWLDTLPSQPIAGVVIANEVLDAFPADRFEITDDGVRPLGVRLAEGGFYYALGAEDEALSTDIGVLETRLERRLPVGYRSEICRVAGAWLGSVADVLSEGFVLLFDYGFGEAEYYHCDRVDGTLSCFYRHRMHDDPFILPGLQDITASVDFSRVLRSAADAGLGLYGYSNQMWYLLDAGIDEAVSGLAHGTPEFYQTVNAVKTLTLPAEMGERIKAMLLTKSGSRDPSTLSFPGFSERDYRDRL
jgi:SAM-dependent MidA family methyltransferase